jgi:hypothetical protein
MSGAQHVNPSTQDLEAASWLTHAQASWLHARGARVVYTRERGWHASQCDCGRLFQNIGLTPRRLCRID